MNISSGFSGVLCDSFKGRIIMTVGCVANLLLLPLFLYVIFIAYKKWKRHWRRSTQRTMSHSDVFTYHMVALEMLGVIGTLAYIYDMYSEVEYLQRVCVTLYNMMSVGQLFFHCLTCGERYLAVVQPITYLRLKERGGVVVRNGCIALSWLCAALLALVRGVFGFMEVFTFAVCLTSFCALIVVTFCSVSVLCVLIGPRPGEGGGDRRMDQSKRAAFNAMVAILGALLLRFGMLLLHYGLSLSSSETVHRCITSVCTFWLQLPSSAVLPLLFIQREAKLSERS